MKKLIIVLVIIAIIAIAAFILFNKNSSDESNVLLSNSQEMIDFIDEMYKKSALEEMGLETREIDLQDEMALQSYTGLTSSENLESVVVSESMITARAYELVLVKVKDGVDVEDVKTQMLNNVDMRKWICVCADRVFVTNHDNVILLVMTDEETAVAQVNAFKELVSGKVGKELSRELEELDF